MRFLAQFVDYFVSVSCESEGLARAEGVPANRSRTIHNGVDLLQFPYSGPRPFGPITLVARLSAEKDVATLIRAVPHLLALLPAEQRRDLVLRVIGDGRERSALEQLAQELGVGSCVHFLGQQQRVAQALGEASLFALSSRTEGISLTLLEAMSRGLPVVATRVGGTPEVVEDGKTGFLVPAQQPEAMAVAIAQIYLNPALAYRMGREGRARAESHFSVARMIEAYQDLYVAPSINQLRSSS
jgi:glycosyltransferase involved in cell wall biosynthesis